jgi:hypothetical protein
MHRSVGLSIVMVLGAGAAAWGAGDEPNPPQAMPALPGGAGRGEAPNQTPPGQEPVIPAAPAGATAPSARGDLPDVNPDVNPDVVPRSTQPERQYGAEDTGAVNPDQLPPGHPFHHFHDLPDPGTPEDVLPAPDDEGGAYDPLETKLNGGTKPAPKQPEGSEGMPAGGYFKPL